MGRLRHLLNNHRQTQTSGGCVPAGLGRALNGPGRSTSRNDAPPSDGDDDTAAVPRRLLRTLHRPSGFNRLCHATGWIVVWSSMPEHASALHHKSIDQLQS